MVVIVEEDVIELDVSVDDPLLVQIFERDQLPNPVSKIPRTPSRRGPGNDLRALRTKGGPGVRIQSHSASFPSSSPRADSIPVLAVSAFLHWNSGTTHRQEVEVVAVLEASNKWRYPRRPRLFPRSS